jgi:hypothetical protein
MTLMNWWSKMRSNYIKNLGQTRSKNISCTHKPTLRFLLRSKNNLESNLQCYGLYHIVEPSTSHKPYGPPHINTIIRKILCGKSMPLWSLINLRSLELNFKCGKSLDGQNCQFLGLILQISVTIIKTTTHIHFFSRWKLLPHQQI